MYDELVYLWPLISAPEDYAEEVPIQTWVDLMAEAGFAVEKKAYPVHNDPRQAYLLVGTLKAGLAFPILTPSQFSKN